MKEPKITVTQEILLLIAEIDEFKGKWSIFEKVYPERLPPLAKLAAIESVASSSRIEGGEMSNSQVELLLSNLNSKLFRNSEQQAVAGYADALAFVLKNHKEFDLIESHIFKLHKQLLRHSKKDEGHRGKYKTQPNHVVTKGVHGEEKSIISVTTTPFATPREMQVLVKWCTKETREPTMHPLLNIAVFWVGFLSIHPFQDGNGRLSRILISLMLLRAGYSYISYESLESVIEENKALYYKALLRTQTTLKLVSPDWSPWLIFFLNCLKKQKNKLESKIDKEQNQADVALPTLSLQILKFLKEHERLTIMELTKKTAANKNTIKVRLRELVSGEFIKRHGKARATWYSL